MLRRSEAVELCRKNKRIGGRGRKQNAVRMSELVKRAWLFVLRQERLAEALAMHLLSWQGTGGTEAEAVETINCNTQSAGDWQ